MIKSRKEVPVERLIDLDGPDGNAMVLLGTARNLCKQLEYDADAICEEMKSSDYTHLVKTFVKYFGGIYTIVTGNEELLEELET